jgi:Phorbol esters/diacylglycerol binding domain (C1 domain)
VLQLLFHFEHVMSDMSKSAQQASGSEGSAFRQRLLGQIQKSVSCEFSSSGVSTVIDNSHMTANYLQTSDLDAPLPAPVSFSVQTEIRARKRPHLSVGDVTGRRDVNNVELNELVAASATNVSPLVQRNRGHSFVSASLQSPTWCDRCGDFIWGVYKQCLICTSEFLIYC